MVETHVISALTKKRAEVSRNIKHYENLLLTSPINPKQHTTTRNHHFK